ncbi:MAG: Gx transporter family protein [Firmicutes bacterium]|nr:Gx transporter family protein [Bacillota bacterium]
MKSLKITYIALLSSLAVVFGYIESLFPLPVPIPGVKLGISNIVILFALIKMTRRDAFFIMLIKIIVCSVLFSGINSLIYSLSGGILSFIAMVTSQKFDLSIIGISMTGGVFHNLGQILAASLLLCSFSPFYYLPVLCVCGLFVGAAVGILCNIVISRLK